MLSHARTSRNRVVSMLSTHPWKYCSITDGAILCGTLALSWLFLCSTLGSQYSLACTSLWKLVFCLCSIDAHLCWFSFSITLKVIAWRANTGAEGADGGAPILILAEGNHLSLEGKIQPMRIVFAACALIDYWLFWDSASCYFRFCFVESNRHSLSWCFAVSTGFMSCCFLGEK